MPRESSHLGERIAALNRSIQLSCPVYRLRKVLSVLESTCCHRAYVITLRKKRAMPLEEQVKALHALLSSSLLPGEKLDTERRCFTISSDTYTIVYSVEACGKNADKAVFIQNETAYTALLRRVSSERAALLAHKHSIQVLPMVGSLPLDNTQTPGDIYTQTVKRALLSRD